MKTILSLLLLLVSLSAYAKPEFVTLPGTPEPLTGGSKPVTNAPSETAPTVQSEAAKLEAATLAADSLAVVTNTAKPATPQPVSPKTKTTTTVSTPAAPVVSAPKVVTPPTPTVSKPQTAKVEPVKKNTSTKASAAANDGIIVMTPSTGATAVTTSDTPAAKVAAPVPAPITVPTSPAAATKTEATPKEKPTAIPTPAATAAAPAIAEKNPEAQPSPVAAPAALPAAPPAPAPTVQAPATPIPAPASTPAVAATPAAPPAPTTPAVPAPPAASRTPRNVRGNEPAATSPAPATGQVIPAGLLRFQAAPLEQVLEFYSDLVKRTLLRPAQLPAAAITINTKTDLTTEEAIQALDSVLGLNGIVTIPVGTKFMKVVPQGEAPSTGGSASTITNAADLPDIGQYITYVAQLKYAKPSEVATSLTPFAKIPNSVLPLDSNGILIIRDYTENVKRMLEMIEKIDVAVPSEFVSEVIPIKYALAADISTALGSISGGGGSTAVGASRAATPTAGSRTLAGANQQQGNQGNTARLGGANANTGLGGGGAAGAQQTFQQRLQNIIQRAQTSGDIQLIGPNKIIADERTNSLLVFATRQDMDTIKDIIGKLDVVLAQVLIEAIIIDVSLGNTKNIGVSAGQRRTEYGGTNGSASGGNWGGQLGGALSFLYSLIQNTNNGGFTPAPNTTPQYSPQDGLKYYGNLNQQFDFTLTAIAGNNDVKVLARPRVQTSHAVPASIFVGETVPYITGSTYDYSGTGATRSQYQQTQVGISLNVLPLINPEGLVVMDIQQQVQQIAGSVLIDGNAVPITQDQNAQTKVAVYNHETIVLGGFIRDQKENSDSGVPYLKDIPYLGVLFRTKNTRSDRRELLVLIRPTVLETPRIAAQQAQVERNRLPGVQTAIAEIQADQIKAMKAAAKQKPADIEAEYRQAAGMPQLNPPMDQVPGNQAPVEFK